MRIVRLINAGLIICGSVAAASGGAAGQSSGDDLAARVRVELAAARKLPPALDKTVTPVIDRVWDGFDIKQAMDQVVFMDQYWRLPGNEGFDKSIDRVKARLVAAGFAELPGRPTAPITKPSLWIEPAPTPSQGWDQSVATLAIVRDGKPEQVVISRAKERLALEINSFSTAPGGVTAPLVDVGRGNAAGDYAGKDVKGAVVIGTASAGQLFTQAVVNRGAIGVVSMAPLPGYLDKNPDILQWGSIPYDETHKGFGFRATERAANALKAAIAEGNARVRAEVVTSFARKPERTLSAEIPGAVAPSERIVIAAHVQEPGANDNASGTATNMELARALVTGVTSGRIPKPARTLTFLWVNEISGSRRWLAEHPDDKAGVRYMFSMDMTGEDIAKTGGHFLIERWPDPGAVWARPWDPHTEWGAGEVKAESLKGDLINDLHMAICERVAAKSVAAIKRPWDVRSNPYEGGSDHTQFGSAGIPSVLDWHFTDRFYHTNQDTSEKTSPEEMRNVGTAVATTAWLMASAGPSDSVSVIELVKKVGAARVAIEEREGASLPDNPALVAAWKKWYAEAEKSVDRLTVKAGGVGHYSAIPAMPLALLALDAMSAPLQICDTPSIEPIPVRPQNVLWAVDDRFFCNCNLPKHPNEHKEVRESELVYGSAPGSRDSFVRLASARGFAHLGRWSPRLPDLLRDENALVRAEAANAIAQADLGKMQIDRLAMLREALLTNTTLLSHGTAGRGNLAAGGVVRDQMPTGTTGEQDAEVVAELLDAMLRLPEADAATAKFVAAYAHTLRPIPVILGATKGLEYWTRTHRGQPLGEQVVSQLRGLAALGRQEFTRVQTAFDAKQDNDVFERQRRIRRLALQTLQNLSDRESDTVIASAGDGDWQVRRIATIMLGALPLTGPDRDTRASAAFEARLKDTDLHVRLEAVTLAARMAVTTGDCLPIENALTDTDAPVAIQALDRTPAACRDLTGKIVQMADTLGKQGTGVGWQVALHALSALARLAPEEAARQIARRDVYAHEKWQVRAAAAAIAGTTHNEALLKELMKDPAPNVRTSVLAALDAMGSGFIYPAAIEALKSTEPQLVREAARRLKGAPKSDDTAIALFDSLKRLTDEGKDTSRDPRMAIFERLDEQEPVSMIGLVQWYLRDFDPEIAAAASKLMSKLVPNATFKADPQLRRPKQAALDEIQSLPRRATLMMADGSKIELELLVDEAPMSVARFMKLARAGYYDGLTFHRIVPNFVIQGGSPDANEYSGDDRFMRDELGRVPHLRGSVGISTRGRDTGDAQIFIDLLDLPRLDHDYTVFATVTAGLDVVDHILEGAVIIKIVV
jgi:cyclophilin family peptidyl-prolyl cis-trans isomerase/HEAT repeat protein